MTPRSQTELALLLIMCVWGPTSSSQEVRQLSIIGKSEYADAQADLYLGASGISPVNGNVLQAVLVKADDETSPYRFYIWELTIEGEKVHEWLLHEGTSNLAPMPSKLLPCLHVLPTGNILTVIVDAMGIPSLLKLDAHGGIIFRQSLAEHRRVYPLVTRIVPAAGGQAFVLGGLRGTPVIWKVDEQGQILFQREIGPEGTGICSDGVRLTDNRFRICGVSRNGDIVKSWVMDVDSQGEVQREFVLNNAPWTSFPHNLRLVHLASRRTAFLHAVTLEGTTYCHVTVLDDALKQISKIKLCEVPDYVGPFEVQRQNKDVVIAVVDSRRALSLYVLDENLKVRAKGDAQDVLPGSPLAFRLAASEDRALVLAQRGSPIVKKSNAIGCAVFSLGDPRGQAPP